MIYGPPDTDRHLYTTGAQMSVAGEKDAILLSRLGAFFIDLLYSVCMGSFLVVSA